MNSTGSCWTCRSAQLLPVVVLRLLQPESGGVRKQNMIVCIVRSATGTVMHWNLFERHIFSDSKDLNAGSLCSGRSFATGRVFHLGSMAPTVPGHCSMCNFATWRVFQHRSLAIAVSGHCNLHSVSGDSMQPRKILCTIVCASTRSDKSLKSRPHHDHNHLD